MGHPQHTALNRHLQRTAEARHVEDLIGQSPSGGSDAAGRMSRCRSAPTLHTYARTLDAACANSYCRRSGPTMEPFYPLRALVCAQLLPRAAGGVRDARADLLRLRLLLLLLSSWLEHCRRYSREMIARFGLGEGSRVVEIASNDGYLLQYFAERRFRCSGSSRPPTSPRSRSRRGISTWSSSRARDRALPRRGVAADLLLGNNVLAHVPDLNDFVGGMKILLKARRGHHDGVPAPDAPDRGQPVGHDLPRALLLLLLSHRQPGLRGRTVCACSTCEELPTHGGSLRIYGCHADERKAESTDCPRAARARARCRLRAARRLPRLRPPGRAGQAPDLSFLIELKEQGLRIAGYGAPGQGQHAAELLRRADATSSSTPCDLNPAQAGPLAARQPHPDPLARAIREDEPDVVLILPWNLKDEIVEQLSYIREWGGRFAARTPELALLS